MAIGKIYKEHMIEQWYDRSTRSWVTQTKDKDGNQVGEAKYSGNRKDAHCDFFCAAEEVKVLESQKTV